MTKREIFSNLTYRTKKECSVCNKINTCLCLNIKLDNEKFAKPVYICKECFVGDSND